MKKERWVVSAKRADFQAIADRFGIDPVIARLIRNRDVTGEKEIEEYLFGDLEQLHDPLLMKDMERAADLIAEKIREKKPIRIIGDYDIDGVTATYILLTGLKDLGADVDVRIPDRIADGYGLNEHLVQFAVDEGRDTIVTCDNGIAASSQIRLAKELGMTVVVTDHHEVPFEEDENGERRYILPPADAVVNPKQKDCSYPFPGLCGAAVAWKLIQAMEAKAGIPKEHSFRFLEFVAIATIGDVMDLQGENRILVKAGLRALHKTQNLGLQELIRVQGIEAENVTPYHIGFVLGPCINASGRLDTAEHSLKLLCAKTREEAAKLAGDLKDLNESRKELTRQGEAKAIELVETSPLQNDKVLVVYLPDCHESLAGIIAGRLREHFHKPSFVLTRSEEGVKGSGRSIGSFNLFEALTSCEDLFERYGGHALAAGLTVQADRIEELRTRLRKYAETHVTMAELVPQLHIDCMVQSEWLTKENIESLGVLEPYGMKNAEPVFCMKNMTVEEITPLSSDRHVRLSLIKDGKRFSAIWFGIGAGGLGFVEGNTVDAAFHLEINEFRGRRSVQLTICDVQLSDCEHLADQKILNLYNTLMQDGPLTAREARLLLPDRKDLVAVWRHVTCRAEDGRLSVPDGALSRRVAWESRRDINIGKLFVCLDVFQESGLISYHFKEGMLNILLKPYEGKADISGSVVLATLQSMAG